MYKINFDASKFIFLADDPVSRRWFGHVLLHYCLSSLHLTNLSRYPPPLSHKKHFLLWCVSWPSRAGGIDAIFEDKKNPMVLLQ